MLAERRLDHPVRLGEGAVQVAVGAGDVVDDVVAHVVEQWRAGRVQSGGVGGHGGQRVVVNCDQLARVLGQAAAVGDDNGHQVADQSHLVGRQGVELRLLHARQGESTGVRLGHRLDVLTGVDGDHPGRLAGLGDVEAGDPGVGDRTAQEGGVEHVRQLHVVDVAAPTGQDPPVLDPLHLGAHEPHLAHPLMPTPMADIFRAASCTPSTIDW